MASKGTKRLARALRDLGLRTATYRQFPNLSGIVRQLKPLTVEIHHADLVLEGDEVVLGNNVRQYDWRYGIEVGDTLLFTADPQGDYHAFSVISQKTSLSGVHPKRVASPSVVAPDMSFPNQDLPTGISFGTVGWLPVHDEDGKILGYTRIWGTVTP